MRSTSLLRPVAALALGLVIGALPATAQEPPAKPPPDEFRALLREVEEAYKAPLEVDKDVLDELRKQYRDPTPEREAKIFREIRRLYVTTPGQEDAIVRELRRAYQQPSPEQEARVFQQIRRGGQLPAGTVPADVQVERAGKTFRKFDRNGDGVLNADEMPEFLRGQAGQWDRNGDGSIDPTEYMAYFQASLKWVSEKVASGEIPIKLPKGAVVPDVPAGLTPRELSTESPARAAPAPPAAAQANLPDWFASFDTDGDGQVGLYEWKKAGRPIPEFLAMDRNHDGFLEAKELLAYLAEHPATESRGHKKR
jgi:Ca2+-binding EF-hand superfamily protein